ncbi:MAG: nucleotide exchange factor GrpE [Nitrososphaerota archaeon]|nr:nucleotide exchange factor GrpE [Nitrososphaerota archaeon]MDG7023995.1 nucleotide exchange factor GrpE [Nitrososphaerota archaeon]
METESSQEGEPEAEATALKQELAEQKKRSEELLTRLKYTQADLENYRKRMDKEAKDASESLARTLLSRLIVVQDELDLAAEHAEDGEPGDALKEGIAMVRGNLRSALESVGLERIEAVGRPFDPAIHEAVERVQGDSPGKDMVVEEVRPGFTFRGQLLRPSMVKVELASRKAKEEKEVE